MSIGKSKLGGQQVTQLMLIVLCGSDRVLKVLT